MSACSRDYKEVSVAEAACKAETGIEVTGGRGKSRFLFIMYTDICSKIICRTLTFTLKKMGIISRYEIEKWTMWHFLKG